MSKEEIALKLTCAMVEGMGRGGDTPNDAYTVAENYKTILKEIADREE